MNGSAVIEVFGHIFVSFTQSVSERFNPEEPEFTAESSGYEPLQSTSLKWNYLPVDELIYQEYSDREVRTLNYQTDVTCKVRVIDACSLDENEEIQNERQEEDGAMAWKRLRLSALRTVGKSMYIGAFISLIASSVIGSLYMLLVYLIYRTELNCLFNSKNTIPVKVQWITSISGIISCFFLYMWFFVSMFFLLRPYQLKGLKGRLFLVSFLFYLLDALYRVTLQALDRASLNKPFSLQSVPLRVLFISSIFCQVYLVSAHFSERRTGRQRATLFLQLILPTCFSMIISTISFQIIYPAYEGQTKYNKLLIAIFSPLIGVLLKVVCRISIQRLWNITFPGFSYVLLAPVYFGCAIVFRVLQAELNSLQSMSVLGIIHGVAEVLERSVMVVIDHFGHAIWKRRSAPLGSFRTPRRERLMADTAIMSMLYESTAIVSLNSVFYLHQFIYVSEQPFAKLFQSFAVQTSILLVIEWVFTSVSLAIETYYQNIAVMAVWRKRWKRHTLVAIVNAVFASIWSSGYFTVVMHGHLIDNTQPCKMPFA